MRWQDNKAIRNVLEVVSKKHPDIPIEFHGWICIDTKGQLNIPTAPTLGEYRGAPSALTFLFACESLLNDTSKHVLGNIKIYNGNYKDMCVNCLTSNQTDDTIQFVSCAKQFTPFAIQRESYLQGQFGDNFISIDDHTLLGPERLYELRQKTEFMVYSPFYRLASTLRKEWKPIISCPKRIQKRLQIPSKIQHINAITITKFLQKMRRIWKPRLIMRTNRRLALQSMRVLQKKWGPNTYGEIRNDINQSTSKMARFLNSGVVSVREVWQALGKHAEAYERELVFRSFYACRMFTTKTTQWRPNISSLTKSEYPPIDWLSPTKGKGKQRWEAWINGTTGVPLIDASMRCLKTTGWLHNRLRMVVASYLTRILRISWRHGESWFAQHLFDYDATQNHFGWKGQASMSKDGAEYFRVMNPWLQANKYDKNTTFIREWIPELSSVPSEIIHSWETEWKENPSIQFPKPLIENHKEIAKESIQIWKQSRNH